MIKNHRGYGAARPKKGPPMVKHRGMSGQLVNAVESASYGLGVDEATESAMGMNDTESASEDASEMKEAGEGVK